MGAVISWMSLPKGRVFLRWPSHDGKRPDGAFAVIDGRDFENGEVVREAVIAEVISERAFGKRSPLWIHAPSDDKVRFGRDGKTVATRDPETPPVQHAREKKLAQAFGQWHDGRERVRRRPADEDAHLERLAATKRGRVVNTDTAMDLIVKADFFLRLVVVAGELHPIHADIRMHHASVIRILRVDLGERDERTTVIRPALNGRKRRDVGAVL